MNKLEYVISIEDYPRLLNLISKLGGFFKHISIVNKIYYLVERNQKLWNANRLHKYRVHYKNKWALDTRDCASIDEIYEALETLNEGRN